LLKAWIFNTRYWQIELVSKSGSPVRESVHYLVLLAFKGKRPAGAQARHLNGNSFDNSCTNLAWGTPLANSDDKRRHGTMAEGCRHGMAKLSESDVIELHCRYVAGEDRRQLLREFGVSRTTLYRIGKGCGWKYLWNKGSSSDAQVKKGAVRVKGKA
jgi:hypothetical protein